MYHVVLLDTAEAPDTELPRQLAQCGFIVRKAGSITDAARLLREPSPALAVIHIGDATAADANPLLRQLPDAPTVVICARHDTDLIVQCLQTGADTVLVRPVSRRELDARLRALLGRGNGYRLAAAPTTGRNGHGH